MKLYRDFLIHLPEKFSETFKTENGTELYGSKVFSKKLLANTIVVVKELPLEYSGPIKVGDTLFVDASLMMEQTYTKGGEQENMYLMDKEKSLFRLPEQLIIAYKRENWMLYGDHVLMERIEEDNSETESQSSLIIMPAISKPKYKKGEAKMFMDVPDYGLKKGDNVLFKELSVNDVKFMGKSLLYTKRRNLLALVLKQAV